MPPPLLATLSQRDETLLDAIFLERPHRFALRVWIPALECEEIVHLGDPGRLGHLLTPGLALQIDGPFGNPKRKTQYTAILAQTPAGTWVSLVSQLPNRLFEPLLAQGHLPWCWAAPEPQPQVQREVTYGHSRIDARVVFDVADTPALWVECKSVTWAEGSEGRFPDAPTKRGTKHLHTLQTLREEGHRAAVLFVVGRDDVVTFSPAAEIDPDFAVTLSAVHKAGVEVYAVAVRLTPDGVWFARDVGVCL